MNSTCRFRSLATTAFLLSVLVSCGPPPVQYQNVDHPDYGSAEFDRDNAQCRGANSTQHVIAGYEDKTVITVDEAKATACLAAKGWHPK